MRGDNGMDEEKREEISENNLKRLENLAKRIGVTINSLLGEILTEYEEDNFDPEGDTLGFRRII